MNRLIIIGNGFDLAHGLKTSYYDFIFSYLKSALIECVKSSVRKHVKSHTIFHYYSDDLIEMKSYSKYFTPEIEIKKIEESETVNVLIRIAKEYFNLSFKSILVKVTFDNLYKYNWVDIESLYFEKLLEVHESKGSIEGFHNEFEVLVKKLEEYLSDIEYGNDVLTSKELEALRYEYQTIFTRSRDSSLHVNMNPIMILNFNYTNTINYFYSKGNGNNFSINNIHGEVNNIENPLIFGFGDEHNKRYLELENEEDKNLFSYIKSINYFKANNYRNLSSFLESGDYEVYILGHSCSVSDRTLLKEIVEHKYCKELRIFYYNRKDGTNDFTEKTISLMRHFSDKIAMRNIIVSEKDCQEMPQLESSE